MKKTTILLLIFIFALVLASCGKKDDKQSQADDKDDPSLKETYVTINGEEITKGEYKDYISYAYAMMDPEDKNNKAVLDSLRDDFIRHRLLLQQAEKEKIKVDQKKFDEMMAAFKSENGSKLVNEYEEVLNIDFESVKEQLYQRSLVSQLLEEKSGNIDVSDKEVEAYYKSKKNELRQGTKAHILHIVTNDEAKAQLALKMLKKGISFEEVAQTYSVAPEADDGGDLGMVDLAEYPAVFKEALKLKPGQTSGVVKSDYGYHIFKLLEVKKAEVEALDDVREELTDELYAIKQEKKLKDYIDALYHKSKIVYAGGGSGVGSADKP